MIDQIRQRDAGKRSVRQCCHVLGLRSRQTYYQRKRGHRPERKDDELATLLREVCIEHPYWGFWKVFHYPRRRPQCTFNHKRMYRIWKREGLNLRRPPTGVSASTGNIARFSVPMALTRAGPWILSVTG